MGWGSGGAQLIKKHKQLSVNRAIYASKIEGGKISLVIELTERPRLTRFDFEGVSKSLAGELEDKIGVIRGRVLTDAALKNTELAIKRHLDSKGFLNADIDLVQQNLGIAPPTSPWYTQHSDPITTSTLSADPPT